MQLIKAELRDAYLLERNKLIRMVSDMTESQLDSASLCTGWNNRAVLGHIISFELNTADILQLLLQQKSLDTINNRQAKRYHNASPEQYIALLNKGRKRILRLMALTPVPLLNRKFIRVPHGKLSVGQLFGDMVIDRAVHYLDIAKPLSIDEVITADVSLMVSTKFFMDSIDLLSGYMPKKFHGHLAKFSFSGIETGTYYWVIGTDRVMAEAPMDEVVMCVKSDANDFIFTLTGRTSLMKRPVIIRAEKSLKEAFLRGLHANALWDK